MAEYYIPKHVHCAFAHDSVIFLDLRSDRYSMLIGEKAHAFMTRYLGAKQSVSGVIWSDNDTGRKEHEISRTVLAELLENDLLTTDKCDAAPSPAADIPLPKRHLFESQPIPNAKISIGDAWRMSASCLVSLLRLKYLRFDAIVRAVELRKGVKSKVEAASLVELRRLVAIYNRMRPLFPKNYLCLFNSLSLLDFLARYGFYPDWVFAVRLDPWSAHCWVQYDSTILNEDTEEACNYLPIMAV